MSPKLPILSFCETEHLLVWLGDALLLGTANPFVGADKLVNQDTLIYARFEIPDCYADIKTLAPPAEAPIGVFSIKGQSLSLDDNLPKNQLLLFRYKHKPPQKVIIRD